MKNSCDVLIVGAGPVGLTMAAFLSHYGVSCQIIDKNDHATQTSNAVGMHARTLELLTEIGIQDACIASGRLIRTGYQYANKKRLATIDLKKIQSIYNFVCDIPQSQTEKHLIDYLNTQQVTVHRQHELINASQDEHGTTATIAHNGQQTTVRAHWLIGCDGYHSALRQTLNIPYVGGDYQYRFFMIDAPIECPLVNEAFVIAMGESDVFMVFPMQDTARIIIEVSERSRFYNSDYDLSIFHEVAERVFPEKITIHEPRWHSRFYVHEKLAAAYRHQRCFILGDAAHVHIPAAGQGMNTGMQDAMNLAWKLAWVIQGKAPATLLDTYEEERRPIAQGVLKLTDRMGRQTFTQNPVLKCLRNHVLPKIVALKPVQQKLVNTIAELAVHYRRSSLSSGTAQGSIKPGDRVAQLPVTALNGRCLLLDFSHDADELGLKFNKILVHHKVHEHSQPLDTALQSMQQGYCLVRPDRYIGYLGRDKQALAAYLEKLMH